MTKKKALIVDDSKLARFVLKEMLREYGLQADCSESAEEALGYLCSRRPDVIFMDHTMPGMDGLKAVEAIKNDPQTAAIPIMMYTSKEGAMYVSQARALGAVGVLPKQLKSVQLGKVLQQLGLIAGGRQADSAPVAAGRNPAATAAGPADSLPAAQSKAAVAAAASAPAAAAAPAEPVARPAAGAENKLEALEDLAHEAEHSAVVSWLKPMLRELLEEQRQQTRGDLRRMLLPASGDGDEGDEAPGYVPPPAHSGNRWIAAAVILALPLLVIAYLLNSNTQAVAALHWQNQQLQSQRLRDEPAAPADRAAARVEASAAGSGGSGLLQAIAWANNHRNTIAFNDAPLGDTALQILSRLVPSLSSAGAGTTLVLITHSAEFCVQQTPSGELALAADSLPFSECTLSEQVPGESIEFSNYLASARAAGNIQVRIENRGNLEPAVAYPAPESLLNAGQWNRIAQQNNRIEIAFEAPSKGVALK